MQHSKTAEGVGLRERACQSACIRLVRRWQFQLNMKALSAEVMSVLGASFLLQRSCSKGRITLRSVHDMCKHR